MRCARCAVARDLPPSRPLQEPSCKPAMASAPIGDWTKAVAEFAQCLRAEVLATAAMTEGLSQRRNEHNEKAFRVCSRTGRFLMPKRPRILDLEVLNALRSLRRCEKPSVGASLARTELQTGLWPRLRSVTRRRLWP